MELIIKMDTQADKMGTIEIRGDDGEIQQLYFFDDDKCTMNTFKPKESCIQYSTIKIENLKIYDPEFWVDETIFSKDSNNAG